MPLVNWNEATPEDLAGFTADFLREELVRRNLDATGPKEEVINRLLADIAQNRSMTPLSPSPDSSASSQRPNTTPLPSSFDAAQSTELLTGLLQQLLQVSQRAAAPVQVTTLPDLSASLPTFNGDGSISASHWIEELERTRNLASWEPSTVLAVALGKLRGAAADWKAVIGRQCPTWDAFRQAFLDQFSAKQTLLQWQQAVTCRVQAHGENLVHYSLAKLKLISGCPVTLTDTQRIEYALQGISDENLATTIAAQRPETVAAYMDIVTQLDQTLSHLSRRLPRPGYSSTKLVMPSPQVPHHSEEGTNVQAVPDKTRQPQRIAALPPDQQEARYLTISTRHGAPAYRSGQNLAEAVCFQCRQKGHLASKCPSRATATQSTTHPSPALHSTLSETLDGSLVQCALVNATIAGSGQVDAFPDSGSKVTLVSRHLVRSLPLLPWTRPPLVVVGGTTVAPAGAICLKISVGPITGLVEAAVLDNNAMPLILGEDWFAASHAQLVFQPPMPTEIRHPTTGTSVRCYERLLPRMSNAVMIQGSSFNYHVSGHHSSAGLQRMPLPGPDEPPWLALSCQYEVSNTNGPSSECRRGASSTIEVCIDPSLPAAQVGSHLPAHQQREITSILSKHAEVFAREEDDLGLYEGVEHSIDLLPDAVPYSRSPYRYSAADRRFLEAQISTLLRQGIILPALGPWAFPAVVVSRGSKKRLCVNYVPLNKMTVNVVQPLPHADDIMDDIAGSQYFACLDLKFAYWQVRVRKEDQAKTAFVTHYGTFMWTRMPFGLKNAPATFQRAMQSIFANLQPHCPKCGVRVYLDDVLVFAPTFDEFARLLDEVLGALLASGFKVSLDKCKFALKSIRFLGFILSRDGKQPDPAKVEAIMKIPQPANSKAVLSWLQTANFYRRFVKNFSRIAAPLQSLIRSEEFAWTSDCNEAFQRIRTALTEAPVLGHFDPDAQTTVTTDASGTAIGAVLSQKQCGKETVIEYASRALTAAEKKLHSNVWECIGVHWAVTIKFRHYLLGKKFCLLTDNWTVACLTANIRPSRRFTTMLMDLTEFDFTVQHHPGRQNVVADMLSRLSAAVLHQTQSLAAMQAEDKECQDLRRSLSSSESWDHDLAIIDDILYHSDATSGSQAIVVPAKMRQAVLEVVHDGGGHMDVTRTLTKVRERYWWPNLTSSVTHYVTACQICQSNNRPISKSVGKMGLMPVSDVPFALIAIDHITMPAASGKKYILNVIDFATRFIVPAAVTSTSAKEVIAHLQSVFFRFGCPDDCMSDHGAAFESHQFKHFMHMHGAEIHYSVAYRAASNGLVERSNGTLVSVLRKLCPTDQTSWASKLEEAAFAINTSYSASSCFSPFELLYGYVPKLPYQRHRPATARTLQDRLLMLSQNRAVAASNTEEAQGKRKTAYDQSHRDHSFQVGQFVWVRRQEPVADGTGKLAPKFKGIYQITNQKTPVTFVVSRVTGQGPRDRLQDRIVHVSQLKHYVPPYVEPYIVKTQEWPLCDLSGSPSVGNELSQPPVSLGPAVLPPAVPSSRPHRQKRPPERLKDYSLSQ